MNFTKILPFIAFALVIGSSAPSEAYGKKKPEPAPVKKEPEMSSYAKFQKKSEKKRGIFTVHRADSKYYLEIPANLLNKELMLSSKISASSDPKIAMAGEMMGAPQLVSFARSNEVILLKSISGSIDMIQGQDEVARAIRRNNINPALESFKIVEKSPKDSSFVIDVTSFILSSSGDMGVKAGQAMGMSSLKLSPNSALNEILDAKAYEKNVNFKCRLSYRVSESPYEALVTRSIIILPEKPMKGRVWDPKMNYFKTKRVAFDANANKSKTYNYINRWNLQPKPEDVEAFKAGKLVEPEKPIVYYVDDAFPENMKKYIKQGIEDWQIAFEKIGFKNAIVAKDFPKNDPNFDPEDIRYSCFRYITVPISNAMGPSWVDPRSGEIIQGSVYMFHDILKLINNWMFTQTAAINPEVRKVVFNEETMGKALRYVAVHEIGHTLGLMHNMKASSNFPVDSLRSPSFTKKYGTTPSIMDYARFNYIAQPGDKISLDPTILGEYDIFSIKMGYKMIFEEDEKPVLRKWFDEVKGNDLYVYGPQSMGGAVDPTSQSEDLGNDPVKASEYGIKNSKFILDHLMKWAVEYKYEPEDLADRYKNVLDQFNTYFGHVLAQFYGYYLYMPDLNDQQASVVPVSPAKRKEALMFLLKQTKEAPSWMIRPEIAAKIPTYMSANFADMQSGALSRIMNSVPYMMNLYTNLDPKYKTSDDMNMIYDFIWKETVNGASLDNSSRSMQYCHIKELMSALNMLEPSRSTSISLPSRSFSADELSELYGYPVAASSIPQSKETYNTVLYKNLCYSQLLKIKDLLTARQNSGNQETRDHYRYLLHEITKGTSKN